MENIIEKLTKKISNLNEIQEKMKNSNDQELQDLKLKEKEYIIKAKKILNNDENVLKFKKENDIRIKLGLFFVHHVFIAKERKALIDKLRQIKNENKGGGEINSKIYKSLKIQLSETTKYIIQIFPKSEDNLIYLFELRDMIEEIKYDFENLQFSEYEKEIKIENLKCLMNEYEKVTMLIIQSIREG